MELTREQVQANEEEYRRILARLEQVVGNLQALGTPEAFEAIDEQTREMIAKIKLFLGTDEQQQ